MPGKHYLRVSFCLPKNLERLVRQVQRDDPALTSRSAAIVRLIVLGAQHSDMKKVRR